MRGRNARERGHIGGLVEQEAAAAVDLRIKEAGSKHAGGQGGDRRIRRDLAARHDRRDALAVEQDAMVVEEDSPVKIRGAVRAVSAIRSSPSLA